MLPAIELFKTRYMKMFGKEPTISREMAALFTLMDEYNQQHFHDRNSLRRDMAKPSPQVHQPDGGCGREWA